MTKFTSLHIVTYSFAMLIIEHLPTETLSAHTFRNSSKHAVIETQYYRVLARVQ